MRAAADDNDTTRLGLRRTTGRVSLHRRIGARPCAEAGKQLSPVVFNSIRSRSVRGRLLRPAAHGAWAVPCRRSAIQAAEPGHTCAQSHIVYAGSPGSSRGRAASCTRSPVACSCVYIQGGRRPAGSVREQKINAPDRRRLDARGCRCREIITADQRLERAHVGFFFAPCR